MSGVKCAVPKCSSASGSEPDKMFWPAPKQEAIRKQWFDVLGVPITYKSAYICEDHFQVEDKDLGFSDGDSNPHSVDSEPQTNGNDMERRHSRNSPSKSPRQRRKRPYAMTLIKSERVMGEAEEPSNTHRRAQERLKSRSPSSGEDADTKDRTHWALGSSLSRKYPETPGDDSDDSQMLVIKSEPEDEEYQTDVIAEDENSLEDPLAFHEGILHPFSLMKGHVKVEADPFELHDVVEGSNEDAYLNKKEHVPIQPIKSGSENNSVEISKPIEMMVSPYLEFIDQPENSYRFRYKRESNKPHGPLKGLAYANKSTRCSCGPKVKLCNFDGEEAVLRVWLFCGNGPSPHQLVASNLNDAGLLMYEPHSVVASKDKDFTVTFDKLNILHVVCGDLDYQTQYYEKKVYALSNSFLPPSDMPPFNVIEIKDEIKRAEKDIVRLFVEAFEKTATGYRKLCDIFSHEIKNKKSPKTNDLKILKQSHEEGSCRGNQQVLIFTERLIKDVCIEFFEEDEDGEITWSSKASFKENDIHKQVAISFWTPPYKDLHITSPVMVFFRLVRSTDGAYSYNRTYKYLPADCPCDVQSLDASARPWRPECCLPVKKSIDDKGVQTKNSRILTELPALMPFKKRKYFLTLTSPMINKANYLFESAGITNTPETILDNKHSNNRPLGSATQTSLTRSFPVERYAAIGSATQTSLTRSFPVERSAAIVTVKEEKANGVGGNPGSHKMIQLQKVTKLLPVTSRLTKIQLPLSYATRIPSMNLRNPVSEGARTHLVARRDRPIEGLSAVIHFIESASS